MWMTAFLLSMQAAGVVVSMWSKHSADKQIQQGRAIEKAGIEMNMAANNYEFQETSLASMQELRQNLGTQAVMQAARGVSTGTESSVGQAQKSISSQKGEQEARRMRLLAREAELRASNVLSGLHTMQSETQLGQTLSKDLFEAASTGIRQFGYEGQNALSSKFGYGKAKAGV
jgi:hypothetical protein